jgi:transcription antitermination factor NusA-like protein
MAGVFNPDEFKEKAVEASKAFEQSNILSNDEEDFADCSLCLLVPETCVAWLIGKNGAHISDLKGLSGANASFAKKETSSQGMRRCIITGALAAVTRATFIIISLIFLSHGSCTTGLIVQRSAAGGVIGKAGANLKLIREQTGCRVTMEKQEDVLGGRSVSLSHPDSPASAAQAIYGIIRTKGFASPTDKPTLPQGGLDVSSQFLAAYANVPPSSRPPMSNLSFSPFGMPDPNVCCVHNKKRGPRNLQPSKTVAGMFECRPEDPCKGASTAPYSSGMFADPSADLMNLYGAMPAAARTPVRFNPYARADPTICVVHNKKRGVRNLQDSKTVPGAFECLPDDQCKGVNPIPAFGGSPEGQAGVCATHGKRRGARNLVPHPTMFGVQVCQESDPCK